MSGSFPLVVCASADPRPGHSLKWGNSMSALHSGTTVGNVYRIASLLALAILWMASFAARPSRAQGTGSSKFHVDSQRLQGTLEKLSEFGRNPEGGVTRIGFSETDMAARDRKSTRLNSSH